MSTKETQGPQLDKLYKRPAIAHMTMEQINAHVEELKAERQTIWDTIKPLQQRSSDIFNQLEKLANAKTKLEMKAPGLNRIAYLMEAYDISNPESSEKYKARDELLREFGFHSFGVWPDTNQSIVSIALTYRDENNFKKVITGINTLLPYIIPAEERKRFQISRMQCDEYTTYELHVYEDRTEVVECGYRRYTEFKGTLENALKYIQENHYYDGPERESYD